MSNTTLTADIIAKEALAILDNELGWLGRIHRAFEDEFEHKVNGYKIGDTLSIRRPPDFTVRSGAVMDLQDVIEGKVTIQIAQQKGIDFQFSSTDLTLKIDELSDRVIKPGMTNLINAVAKDVLEVACLNTYHWVGTPHTSTAMNSFADFAKGPERMDLAAIPQGDRIALLNPQDYWGFIGAQTAIFVSDIAKDAIRRGELGMIAGLDTYMTQVLPSQTMGTSDNTTPLVDGTAGINEVSYDTAKNTWTQSLVTDGWDSSSTITQGTVFTIADCYMVNPKTKVRTNVLQQFVVTATVTANETTTNDTTLTISPPIITSGPHQTVEFTSAIDDNAITVLGASSGAVYPQNLMMHKNAMALAMVPMEMPQGSVNGSRRSRNGLSVRILPIYDGINDVSKWRLDLLYGRRLIDPRLSVRVSQS